MGPPFLSIDSRTLELRLSEQDRELEAAFGALLETEVLAVGLEIGEFALKQFLSGGRGRTLSFGEG
jgi:hypothetical protein